MPVMDGVQLDEAVWFKAGRRFQPVDLLRP